MVTLTLYFNAPKMAPGDDLPDYRFYYLSEDYARTEDAGLEDENVYAINVMVQEDTIRLA